MAETRRCERCGMEFMPKREHARFCSARCRVAWNRENWNLVNRDQQKWGSENWDDGDRRPGTEPSALGWALVAMCDTTDRLGKARASDRAQAFAVIGEAVWWVTIVDATLVRHYPDDYDAVLDGLADTERHATETTFAGLRFVRNRMGYHADHADFIQPCLDDAAGGDAPITEWTWRSLPEPAVGTLPPRGQEWELSRYQAYQDVLAGQHVGETFVRTSDFHDLVARTARTPGAAGEVGEQAAGASGERRASRRVT